MLLNIFIFIHLGKYISAVFWKHLIEKHKHWSKYQTEFNVNVNNTGKCSHRTLFVVFQFPGIFKHFCHFVNYVVIFDVFQVLDLYKKCGAPFEVILTRVLCEKKRYKNSNNWVIKYCATFWLHFSLCSFSIFFGTSWARH